MRCILLCAVLVGLCPASASAGELNSSQIGVDYVWRLSVNAAADYTYNLRSPLSAYHRVPKEIIEIRAEGAG